MRNKIRNQIVYSFLYGLFMLNSACNAPQSDFAGLRGHFDFDTGTEEVKLLYVVDGMTETYATTLKNEKGDFGFMVPVKEPGFYYVDYGQMRANRKDQLIRLYMEPGLDIDIDIAKKDYELSGKKTGHNNLVREANKIFDTLSHYTTLGKMNATYKNFYPFIEQEAPAMVEEFKKKINTADENFNELLKLTVDTDLEVTMYKFPFLPRMEHPGKDTPRPEIYDRYRQEAKFANPGILRLGNGHELVNSYFTYWDFQNGFRTPRQEVMENAVNTIVVPEIKEVYVREGLRNGHVKIEEYGKIKALAHQYVVSEKGRDFLLEFEKALHKDVGQPGFEFTYDDTEGKPVSFSDFKGKYVYVDVWATWCGPCKKEIPFLKELEKDYHNRDIVFMSISVDKPEDREKWKDFVKKEALGGVQLMADKDFQSGITKNYDINGIPRFLLFDREGKIVSTDALRPSNPELREQLDQLLKRQ
ncbi:TlpA family protein disulfide reductase [Sinomicrobium soli]|uniref:TlpA family protein disulfide reductase n=1 Tax=Sinomicrobium sp. N-1-3-6 TaxID=2219864 RepID=UPI000DCE8C6B|nr:TlpA disulfide reductase family protein [Sinomicrobium sp. N-1-3-6]RAV28940.1 hypothetical protein DN748_11145 [Sinomicrobium sp. N-1-3-6]